MPSQPTKKPVKKSVAPKPRTKTEILKEFRNAGARIETKSRVKIKDRRDMALWYTPGVGTVSSHLAEHPEEARLYSIKKNSVAVISDGTAVLGLGNIGPYGALPVMEGKALIFKEMAGIDAWPIVLDTQDTDRIVETIIAIAPAFGGINLEDFAAPACFEIEQRVAAALQIPVMHDDQHGTAIVALAGLMNAAKVVGKNIKKLRIVISGAGAAGVAITKLFIAAGITDIMVLDTKGIIHTDRPGLTSVKQELATLTNAHKKQGDLMDALTGADVFIGVSGAGALTGEHVQAMNPRSIIFAMANPVPEIMPDIAHAAGAGVVATGRSDFPNQINNALVFPGVFRGALDKGITKITTETKLRAAKALAGLVEKPTEEKIIPDIFDKRVVPAVSKAVR